MDATQSDITFKTIVFKSDGNQQTYETNGDNAIIIGSSGKHDHGSSKVKLRNIVDYKWEQKHYNGRLIANHIGGKYVAYAIKVGGKDGKIEGMVRVVTPANGHRALIRGKTTEVLDLQFAHMRSQVLLASIEATALHVHKIETLNDNIICTDVLKIDDPVVNYKAVWDRVHWCPYVPESETEAESDIGKILIWTRDERLQCFNVETVVDTYGVGTHSALSVTEGYMGFYAKSNVTNATLSPDGTTMAVTYESGEVHFYQVNFQPSSNVPELLHQWKPHGGKPVNGLFFLDDHSKFGIGTSLWKHAITMSDNNTEFKIWCCATWDCLQTVRFESNTDNTICFNAEIDPTSSYLVLTDTMHRCLYVLQVMKTDVDTKTDDSSTNGTRSIAYIKSVSEFPVSLPILSFGIVDASVRKYKCAYDDNYLLDELDDYDDDDINRYCVVIHMFSVQPKSVQECHVLFQPSLSLEAMVGSTLSGLTAGKGTQEDLSKVLDKESSSKGSSHMAIKALTESTDSSDSSDAHIKIADNNKVEEKTTPQQSTNKSINLLTPDSFQTAGKTTPEGVSNEVYTALRMLAGEGKKDLSALSKLIATDACDGQVEPKKVPEKEEEIKSNEEEEEDKAPLLGSDDAESEELVQSVTGGGSIGSSPSREVQEILSQKESEMNDNSSTTGTTPDDDSEVSVSGNNGEIVDGNDDEKSNDVDYNALDNDVAVVHSNNGLAATNEKIDWPDAPTLNTNENLFKITKTAATETTPLPLAINDVNDKLDQLLEIIHKQNSQIAKLTNEVTELKHAHSTAKETATKPVMTVATPAAVQPADLAKVEASVTRIVEDYLSRYEREHSRKLDAFTRARDSQIREIREQLFMTMAPALCTQITTQLSQILLTEIQKSLFPIVSAKLDSMKAQVHNEIAQKLTVTDRVVKENLLNMCRSKETMETFGNSVTNAVRNGMHHVYADTLKTVIIPAYEKANNELFKQLYDTFNKGTIGYANQLASYTKTYEPIHNELVKLMRTLPEQMRNMNEVIVNTCSQRVTSEVNKDLKSMQSNLLKTLKENLKMEIKKGFEAQAASLEDSVMMAVRSTAQTPAPTAFDLQEQIRQLLIQNHINKAFHQALLANDLQLVEYVLERADYSQVFNPCPLEQTVLLSLIQQISADMSNHSDLKQKYLSDAIIHLNMRDPITKEHAPKVLIELSKNCQAFVSQNPQNSLCSGVRMLIMAVQGVSAGAI